jgi:nucleoside-diphosphate kinase
MIGPLMEQVVKGEAGGISRTRRVVTVLGVVPKTGYDCAPAILVCDRQHEEDSLERTFVMVKPDGVQRGLIGEIVCRLEQRGLRLVAMKMLLVSRDLAETHYGEHRGKGFYDGLISYITSGPSVAMVWEGTEAIKKVRSVMGATRPIDAAPGTIRGDFGMDTGRNLVHGSDGQDSAAREISLFFQGHELIAWVRSIDEWVFE